MEIYRQRINRVWFEAPDSSTLVTALISLNGSEPVTIPVGPDNPTNTSRWVDVPYINNEGVVEITWSFQAKTFLDTGISDGLIEHKDTYEVVTPILDKSEIKIIHPNATDDEVVRVEKAVRHVINAFTGQTYGRYEGVRTLQGSGSKTLLLPQRLLSVNAINGSDATSRYAVDANGYVLRFYPWGVPPVKADYYGLHMHTGGVIHNPNDVRLGEFDSSKRFEIDGLWGWEEVPNAVREAAKLLVNDYACADQSYRDRYLTSMTAADWRIQFHAGAFSRTGNVRADQLLSDYILMRGWSVI